MRQRNMGEKQMDEQGCKIANRKYMKAVRKYRLHKIRDGHGQGTKRYMSDGFISGFYAGRDYIAESIGNRTGTDSVEEFISAFKALQQTAKDQGAKDRNAK